MDSLRASGRFGITDSLCGIEAVQLCHRSTVPNGFLMLDLSAMATSRAKIMFDALDGLIKALEQMPEGFLIHEDDEEAECR